jgi:AcrR family transcriptional regulator
MSTSTVTLLSSRDRILLSAKGLFAKNSYENTSTVAIARQAGTSESQLMKHFGSKQGLLFAILELGWSAILHRAYALSSVPLRSPQTLVDVLESLVVELDNDPEMKTVLVLEWRRARRENQNGTPGEGYLQFSTLLENILKDLKQRGILRPELSVSASAAALFGAVEGILFEQVVGARDGRAPRYELEDVRRVLDTFIFGLAPEAVASTESVSRDTTWSHAG